MTEHTPLPWYYRPCRHDDWGWIRGPSSNGEMAPLVALARSGEWESTQMLDDHRSARTDPYEANAAFIVHAVNNHDALVEALDGLIVAAEAEVNEKGGGGFILARLSDARTALRRAKHISQDRLTTSTSGQTNDSM